MFDPAVPIAKVFAAPALVVDSTRLPSLSRQE
jgi:hypothetical protein